MSRGIYGIYIGNELVYIGQTTRSFKKRWREHLEHVENKNLKSSQQNFLYKAMRETSEEISFKALVPLEGKVSKSQLDAMEYALIVANSPKFNYQGVLVPYPGMSEYNNKREVMTYNLSKRKDECQAAIKSLEKMLERYHSLEEEAKELKINIDSYNTCKKLKAEWESRLSLLE